MKKGQQINLEISHIAFGGKGLAKPDGFAVFVDKAVPGDLVKAQITRKKKNYAEARVVELLTASSDRIDSACPYSGYCGGCKWQFLDYEKQLVYKRQHVAEALAHIGGIETVPVHETIPSKRMFGYRNKMEFSCSDRRWVLPSEMDRDDLDRTFALGLHVPGTFNKVIDTEVCLLHPLLGNDILATIRQTIRSSELPPYGLKSHAGYWRFVMLRNSAFYGHWMVNIVTGYENTKAMEPLAHQLMERYPDVVSVINNITARKSSVAVGESEVLIAGEPFLKERIGSFEFIISANSFFQTNSVGAQTLYDKTREYAELQGSETILDLYSGTGTIAIYLAETAKQIIGIEQVESAVRNAERNCRINHVSNCRFVQGDIKDKLPQLTEKPQVVIIDPPRAGMHKDVIQQILRLAPERIVYVSCNPASLARDTAILLEAYDLLEVQPVDMFPHTYHIEAVAKLGKR
ncbi:23S rRNA (uracil(1939)-C(5))-methyltransferase RlmD [Thermodesulfobacteriota bacterium]